MSKRTDPGNALISGQKQEEVTAVETVARSDIRGHSQTPGAEGTSSLHGSTHP